MTTQPESLRLAEIMDDGTPGWTDCCDTAAELRRLHAVNQELLEALKVAMLDWENMRVVPSASRAHKAARAAIARAEGKA